MDKEITLIIEEPEDKEEPLLVIDKEECLLEKAEKDIEREIQILQEQLALSKEIKRKRELHKEAQNKKIEALKAEMVAKTLQYNNEMANISTQIENLENNKIINIDQIMDTIDDSIIDLTKKKTRAVVKRRPLYEVIKSPTNFKTTIKGIEFICYTEDGRKIVDINKNDINKNDINTFSSLNEWLDNSIASICSKNTTKKSVYEVVLYYNNAKKEWRQLKLDYNSDTVTLN